MSEWTLHTGGQGAYEIINIDWFDENNIRHQHRLCIDILDQDKPRTLQILLDGKVLTTIAGADAAVATMLPALIYRLADANEVALWLLGRAASLPVYPLQCSLYAQLLVRIARMQQLDGYYVMVTETSFSGLDVRWSTGKTEGTSECFPHIYGALPPAAVQEIVPLTEFIGRPREWSGM